MYQVQIKTSCFFNLSNSNFIGILASFCKWRKRDVKKLNNSLRPVQFASGKASIGTQAFPTWVLCALLPFCRLVITPYLP